MAKCPSCGKDYLKLFAPVGKGICYDCHQAQEKVRVNDEQQKTSQLVQQRAEEAVRQPQTKKYQALRVVVGIYYLLAFVVGIAAIVFVGIASAERSLALGVASVLVGFCGSVSCIAAAEIIKVFLDTEENTRNCYSVLWHILNKK